MEGEQAEGCLCNRLQYLSTAVQKAGGELCRIRDEEGGREEIAGLQQEPLYLSVVDVGCRTPMEHDRAGEKAAP